MPELARRDADALVAHAHDDLAVLLGQPHADRATPRRVLDGVGEQVVQHLLEVVAVGGDDRRRRWCLEHDVVGCRGGLHAVGQLADQLGEVELGELELDLALLDARDVEQLVDEPRQLARLARQRVEVLR